MNFGTYGFPARTNISVVNLSQVSQNSENIISNTGKHIIAIYEKISVITPVTPNNLTSNISNANFVVNQSSAFSTNYNGFRLFDNVLFTEPDWCSSSTSLPQWVSIDFLTPISINSAILTPSNVAITNGGTPKDYKIQGSFDNSTWIDVYSTTGDTWSVGVSKTIYFATANYRYWRLFVSNTTSSGTLTRLGELVFSSPSVTYWTLASLSNYEIKYLDGTLNITLKKLSAGTLDLAVYTL